MADAIEDDTQVPSFRPAKRRKVYRKRDDEPTDEAPRESTTVPSPQAQTLDDLILSASTPTTEASSSNPIADLIRQRKSLQRKRHGIEFSTQRPTASSPQNIVVDEENAPREEKLRDWDSVSSRFAPQTGQAVSVDDKHMFVALRLQLCSLHTPSPPVHTNSH